MILVSFFQFCLKHIVALTIERLHGINRYALARLDKLQQAGCRKLSRASEESVEQPEKGGDTLIGLPTKMQIKENTAFLV